MRFVDVMKIRLKAGDGGRGCISFRREKYVPRGGPDGGNGGNGGNIILLGDTGKHTLLDFNFMAQYKADRGQHGKGKDMHGSRGRDLILRVPLGTIVKNSETGEVIVDITEPNKEFVIAKGGRGGRGNAAFITPSRRAPRICEEGEEGESLEVILELKLIADVGIIGFPNAGKSTFISVVSAARPKVADYPFTTLVPNLGVVKGEYGQSFVLADMPGLIEGASDGAGLGIRFLKHIERTKILVHFIDSSDEKSMIERYETIRNELSEYSDLLDKKQEVIVATKIDSANQDNLEEFEKYLQNKTEKLYKISSLTKDGLNELIKELELTLKKIKDNEETL
jgi:GTP-binding protein